MNKEQKKRARELIKNTDHAIGLGIMKQLLRELIDAPEQASGVPDGWKLVPVEPTPEMMRSGMNVPFNKAARHNAVYRAMLAAAPTPAEAPEDVASEPVGYLYTNVQSGEYHVSDADDDYRGPERVLWCIEPVYRRSKGGA